MLFTSWLTPRAYSDDANPTDGLSRKSEKRAARFMRQTKSSLARVGYSRGNIQNRSIPAFASDLVHRAAVERGEKEVVGEEYYDTK